MNTLKIRALIFVVWLAGLRFFTATSFAAPTAPTGLWAYPSASDQIYVAWDETPNTTNYKLQWKQNGQASWQEIVGYPYTDHQHLNLKCNTGYSYRVAAVSLETGQSPWSNTVSATTLACPPGPSAPSNLKATAKNQSEIGLTWNDVQGETGYEVEYSSNGQNFNLLHVTGANQTSMNDVALSCGTARHYRVRAINNNGKSTYSNTAFAATTACSGPITVELLTNGGFETNTDGNVNIPDGWIAKGGMSGDKLVNSGYGDGYFVYAGNNAMLFRGNGTSNDRIYQGVNVNKVAFHVGDKLNLSARINHVRGGDDAKLVWATIAYSDGTKTDIKLNTQAKLEAGFVYRANFFTLTRTDISAIVVRIGYNKVNGKLSIDNVSLTLTQAEAAMDMAVPNPHITTASQTPGLLTLPAAPTDMRGN